MTPHELAEKRLQLSADFQAKTEEFKKILRLKAPMWKAIRVHTKSDTSADREWESLPEGIREMELKLEMKSLEKEMSAIRTMLEVLTAEAHNTY